MTSLPTYFIGLQVSVFALTGQTAAASGTLTADTDVNDYASLGVLDKATFNFHVRHEEISPCTVRIENEVIVSEGFTVDLEEIISVGGQSNIMEQMMGFDYFKIAFNATSADGGYTGTAATAAMVFYAVRGDARFEINRGKSLATLQLKTAGVDFTYTTTG